jgi:hypothetical protein
VARRNRGWVKVGGATKLVKYGKGKAVHLSKGGKPLCDQDASNVRASAGAAVTCGRCIKIQSVMGGLAKKGSKFSRSKGRKTTRYFVPTGREGLEGATFSLKPNRGSRRRKKSKARSRRFPF